VTQSPPTLGDEPGYTPGESLLFNLVYCSRAAQGASQKTVDQIIQTSQRNNPAHDITGLLVFGNGVFFQWLEGPRAEVSKLMDNIKRDPRHTSVVELSTSEEIRERVFPDWGMELVSPEEIQSVLEDAMSETDNPNHQAALALLIAELDRH
jgi:hypothetical protein